MIMAPAHLNESTDPAEATTHSLSSPGITIDIDQYSPEQWSKLICTFDDATCDQTFALRAERWGNERLSTIVVRHDGEALACALLVTLKLPVIERGFAYLKMGPLWRRKGQRPDLNALSLITKAINNEYSLRRRLLVMALMPPDPDFMEAAGQTMLAQNFKVQQSSMDPNRYLVNVKLSEDEQLKSLNQKWRYNLRKSLKNDFEITVHESEAAMARFIALYSAMVNRKQLATKTPDEVLLNLIRELPAAMKPKIVLVSHDGQPTAGAIIGNVGCMASYIFGATDNRALPLKAGYAMQWWIINWLGKQQDVHWYDLGGDGDDPGLRQFKKGLTGKEGHLVMDSREFETWNDPISRIITEGITTSRSMSRNLKNIDLNKIRDWFHR